MREYSLERATDNIILMAQCGEHVVGDDFVINGALTFSIYVCSTNSIRRISIICNHCRMFVHDAPKIEGGLTLNWSDEQPLTTTAWYHVRVKQTGGKSHEVRQCGYW